ncbi:MAG: hypothetical protein K2J20_06805, partial [Bacilli bacterium]|nr:hypothetical protein [Bacilli bacterium]
MKKFIIMEVGSTNTKASLYDGELKYLSRQTIEFKSNFKKEQKIKEEDKQKLYNFIHELEETTPKIYVYGTS